MLCRDFFFPSFLGGDCLDLCWGREGWRSIVVVGQDLLVCVEWKLLEGVYGGQQRRFSTRCIGIGIRIAPVRSAASRLVSPRDASSSSFRKIWRELAGDPARRQRLRMRG